MKSPYISIIKYGAKPVNNTARRVIGHRVWGSDLSFGREPSPYHEIGEETGNKSARRRICPYCGKAKLGLTDHIRTKHVGKALVPGKPEPLTDENDTAGINEKAGKLALSLARSGKGRFAHLQESEDSCAFCKATTRKLISHLRDVRKARLIECPYCFEKLASVRLRSGCPSCGMGFKLSKAGKLIGFRIECPFCFNDSYFEKTGDVKCTFCKRRIEITKSRKVSQRFLKKERLPNQLPISATS